MKMKYDNLAASLQFQKEGRVFYKEIKGFKVYFKDWAYLIYSFGAFYIPCNKEITTPILKKIEQEAFGNVGALFTIGSKNDTLIMSLESGNKEDKKVQAENMRLKKRIYELEREIAYLKSFIGVK